MRIRFARGKPGKRDTLVCERPDGTTTWAPLHPGFGAVHDLAHYAVETVLRRTRSFYGLLAGGMDIRDFDVAGAVRALDLPPEAGETEFIVGLVQMERVNGTLYDDFASELRRSLAERGAPMPADMTPEAITRIRAEVDDLVRRWMAVPPGGSLELDWPG